MLELLYDTDTLEARAWNADPLAVGNFSPTDGQGVIILPEDPPTTYADVYYVDLDNPGVYPNPHYVPPPEPPDVPALISCIEARLLQLSAWAETQGYLPP